MNRNNRLGDNTSLHPTPEPQFERPKIWAIQRLQLDDKCAMGSCRDKKMNCEGVPIGIISYKCGNILSIRNALAAVGVSDVRIIESPQDLDRVTKIILPGVGAFDSACLALKAAGLFQALQEFLLTGSNKALGVCLGMQILCASSDEGKEAGLGVVEGSVKLLSPRTQEKIPHVGWNTVKWSNDDPILEGLGSEQDFYFLHSFHVIPGRKTKCLGITEYGHPVTAMLRSGNIWGVQFHPEKSQSSGLKILSNFVKHA